MSRTINAAVSDLFGRLTIAPTDDERTQFENDLRVVSSSLMLGAVEEIVVAKAGSEELRPVWRSEVFKTYNRKVAEHAQLFPVFHSFETAYRSTVAVKLEDYYGVTRWWQPVLDELQKGRDHRAVTQINSKPITSSVGQTIWRILSEMMGKKYDMSLIATGFELLDACDLGQVWYLIDAHWTQFSSLYSTPKGPAGRQTIDDMFRKIREARNAVYHHRSFQGMGETYIRAEYLLDAIGFKLPLAHYNISQSKCAKPGYRRPFEPAPLPTEAQMDA